MSFFSFPYPDDDCKYNGASDCVVYSQCKDLSKFVHSKLYMTKFPICLTRMKKRFTNSYMFLNVFKDGLLVIVISLIEHEYHECKSRKLHVYIHTIQ